VVTTASTLGVVPTPTSSPSHSPPDTTFNVPSSSRTIPTGLPPQPPLGRPPPFPELTLGCAGGLMPVIWFFERVVAPGGLECLTGTGLGSVVGVGTDTTRSGYTTPSTPSKAPVLPSSRSPTPRLASRSSSPSDVPHRPINANGNAIDGYLNHGNKTNSPTTIISPAPAQSAVVLD
jgi:hypothetical protein